MIVHLFEWPWASIASECTTVLGPKGFGAAQVSPPQEHVVLPLNTGAACALAVDDTWHS